MKNVLIYWTYYIGYLFSIQFEIMTTSDKDEKSIYKNKMMVLKLHHSVGQRYDGKYPYFYHLKMVAEMADKFSHILSKKNRITAILIALWHDAIEDCRLTYNDLVKIVGVEVADGVYACTELRGRNRKERHGPEYLKTLQESRLGTYGKISDIAANMTMGKRTGSRMFPMYTKEFPKVKKELYREEFKIMFDYIENDIISGYNFSKINKESKLYI